MSQQKRSIRDLTVKTITAYVRMSSTVVIAVVVRIFLDCIGIIFTGQKPTAVYFWFAHCGTDRTCVLSGIVLFWTTLTGCSFFAWACRAWIMDPVRNRYSGHFSFAIIIEAATWVPISVVVGKTNALVEYWMDSNSADDRLQALLASSLASVLTLSCGLLTHFAMKYCSGVQRSAQVSEAGLSGFGKFFLLATLYCLGWAVGWSNWELVLALMDALEPGVSFHNTVLATVVILVFLVMTMGFYLKFGPEPIIPHSSLQDVCYSHGYSDSILRSLISYMVYSCVVFLVMCFCDPTYGLLIVVAKAVYSSSSMVFDVKALLVLFGLGCLMTTLCALCSAAITWYMEVDESSSMKLSRSVHNARQKMVERRRSRFEALLVQVLVDRSDARLVMSPAGQEMGERPSGWRSRYEEEHDDDGNVSDHEDIVSDGDDAAGPQAPRCIYQRLDDTSEEHVVQSDLDSERQLQLDPGVISYSVSFSVLLYDVLGLVVCFIWGMIALRLYSVTFGALAKLHSALYVVSCLLYAVIVIISLSRAVFVFFPSDEELQCRTSGRRLSFRAPLNAPLNWMELAGSMRTRGASGPWMLSRATGTFDRKRLSETLAEREAFSDRRLLNTGPEEDVTEPPCTTC